MKNRFMAAGLAILMGAGVMFTPIAAQANDNGRKTAALGLGALAAGLLLTQRDKTAGIIAGVGAALLASSGNDHRRNDYDRYGSYDYRYDNRDYRARDYAYSSHDYRYDNRNWSNNRDYRNDNRDWNNSRDYRNNSNDWRYDRNQHDSGWNQGSSG